MISKRTKRKIKQRLCTVYVNHRLFEINGVEYYNWIPFPAKIRLVPSNVAFAPSRVRHACNSFKGASQRRNIRNGVKILYL